MGRDGVLVTKFWIAVLPGMGNFRRSSNSAVACNFVPFLLPMADKLQLETGPVGCDNSTS